MRALLVVSKAQATVRALSIRKAGATTLTLLAVSLCGPEPGTVWRARRAVAFYDRRQDTRAGGSNSPGFFLLRTFLNPRLRSVASSPRPLFGQLPSPGENLLHPRSVNGHSSGDAILPKNPGGLLPKVPFLSSHCFPSC